MRNEIVDFKKKEIDDEIISLRTGKRDYSGDDITHKLTQMERNIKTIKRPSIPYFGEYRYIYFRGSFTFTHGFRLC